MSRASPDGSHRGLFITMAVVIGLILALVIADRVAAAMAESHLASQMRQRGFSAKPRVSIKGFPFLTQLAARDFREVRISGAGEHSGPLDVRRIVVTLHDVRVNSSYSKGTVARLDGMALIGFAGIAEAAGTPGLHASSDGHGHLRITADLGFLSGTAIAQVTAAGPRAIHVKVLSLGGLPASALGSLADATIPMPALPMRLTIRGVDVSAQGLLVRVGGDNVPLKG